MPMWVSDTGPTARPLWPTRAARRGCWSGAAGAAHAGVEGRGAARCARGAEAEARLAAAAPERCGVVSALGAPEGGSARGLEGLAHVL